MSGKPVVSAELVRDFVSQRRLAIAGVSRSGRKFGNLLLRELKARGYEVVPVHPEARELQGLPCAKSLAELKDRVDGVVVVTPPSEAVKLVRDAADAGIGRVWLQQGAESEEAVRLAEERGVAAVRGHCLLMFLPQTGGIHGFHRLLWRLLGKLPAEAART